MERKLYVIDSRPDRWDTFGPFDHFTDAVKKAVEIWSHLTEREKAGRDLMVGTADPAHVEEEDFFDTFDEWLTEKDLEDFIENEDGELVSYSAAVAYMDDEIREEVHLDMAPCSNQSFYNEYAKRHEEKFGEPFSFT